jgi:transposase InsO family protein
LPDYNQRQARDIVLTLSYDNGREFADQEEIARELTAEGFFAHPYHSWERGLNENTNGLIRQYIPKGKDIDDLMMKTWPRSSRRLTCGPENALASRPQISYSYSVNSLLRWQVESALYTVTITIHKGQSRTSQSA